MVLKIVVRTPILGVGHLFRLDRIFLISFF